MLPSNRSIKSHNISSSYGSTYYSYYSPSIMSNTQINKSKRLRVKNSYVEIAKEKKDLISYEVVQIKGYSEKNKAKEIYSQSVSCPKFANNKNIRNIKNKFMYKKNKQLSCYRKEISKEPDYEENIPYPMTLRNFSRIINNKKNNNSLENKEKIYNARKRNCLENFKISNKIKELLKNRLAKNDNDLNINKKEENSTSVCLEKISIETYTIRNENNNMIKKDILDINDKMNNLQENKNEIINDNNKEILEMDDEKNLINYEFINNIFNKNIGEVSFKKEPVKRILNYEEEKNDENQNKTQFENKIIQTVQKRNFFIEKTKSILIKNNNEKNNKNNLKKNIKSNESCPKVLHSNKISNSNIVLDDFFKENINKILKRNTKIDLKRKKYFKKKNERKYNIINYKFINNNFNINDEKLEELLKKIPKHENNGRNKSIIQFEPYQQNTFNTKRTNRKNIHKLNISSVMPPNNLKEIVLKKEINFLLD